MVRRATTTRQRADQERMTWKTPLVGLGCGMLLWAGVASAGAGGRCRQIEYAELRDMESEQLHIDYCVASQMAKVHKAFASDAMRPLVGPLQSYQAAEAARECADMSAKILTAIKSRSQPTPDCSYMERPLERKEEGAAMTDKR